jgi:transposase
VFMSKGKRYTEEFKIEAVKQVTERGYSVQDVAERLGVTTKSLYYWKSKFSDNKTTSKKTSDDSVRIAKLEAELKRVTEERDILKKAARYFASHPE